ncbi:hypothetical protein Tco_0696109 [Tanacetum coccineum]
MPHSSLSQTKIATGLHFGSRMSFHRMSGIKKTIRCNSKKLKKKTLVLGKTSSSKDFQLGSDLSTSNANEELKIEIGRKLGIQFGDETDVVSIGRGAPLDPLSCTSGISYPERKPVVIGIQETKLAKISEALLSFLWGHSNIDFLEGDAIGSSGGTLLVWDSLTFFKKEVVCREERLGSSFVEADANAFNDFTNMGRLQDFALGDNMAQMGFGVKWRKWIYTCLSSASVSILINALQVMVTDSCNKGIYKGLSLYNDRANISLPQYADDALFFGEWSKINVKNLIRIINCFHDVSRLKTNISKCKQFGIGVLLRDVENIARAFNCSHGSLPFSYLGGRLTLVNSVLGILPTNNWLKDSGPLKDCFPRLFALEQHKDCLVADRWVMEKYVWQGKWAWTRQPSGRAVGDLTKLVSGLNGFTLDESQEDKWEWVLTSSRKFTVASLCRAIQLRVNTNDVSTPPFSWNSWVPRKVNVSAWRVALDRLPTRLSLCERGINLPPFAAHTFSTLWNLPPRYSLCDILPGYLHS